MRRNGVFSGVPYVRHIPFIGAQGAMHSSYKNLFSVASVLLMIISFYMALMELFRAKARAEQSSRALAHEIEERQRAEEARLQMLEKVQAARKFESLAMAAGAIRAEVLEAAAIGVEFGGGPSFVVVRDHLLEFMDDIESEKKERR